jgi:hypothetical protein
MQNVLHTKNMLLLLLDIWHYMLSVTAGSGWQLNLADSDTLQMSMSNEIWS